MAITPGAELLAEMVRRRREHLDLTQIGLSALGGPQVSTVSKIERGAQARYSARTQRQIERALGWGERTVRFLLGEGVPPNLGDEVWEPFLASLIGGNPPLPAPQAVFEDDPWNRELAPEDFQRVGRYVREARESLGLSQQDIAALGGPGVATLRLIEAGKPAKYRISSTWPLERALGWSPGSFEGAIRYGHEPGVLYRPDYQALRDPDARLERASAENLVSEIARRLGVGPVTFGRSSDGNVTKGDSDVGSTDAEKNTEGVSPAPDGGSEGDDDPAAGSGGQVLRMPADLAAAGAADPVDPLDNPHVLPTAARKRHRETPDNGAGGGRHGVDDGKADQ